MSGHDCETQSASTGRRTGKTGFLKMPTFKQFCMTGIKINLMKKILARAWESKVK
jgi:hypothetical protein